MNDDGQKVVCTVVPNPTVAPALLARRIFARGFLRQCAVIAGLLVPGVLSGNAFSQSDLNPIPPASGGRVEACPLRLANLGKQRGARCRDGLDGGGNGPELVVVKVNGVAPFAITRSEISGNDIAAFCNQTRLCQPPMQPALPVVNLPLEHIQRYAGWLTARSGSHYRLPRLDEWLAVARNDSGMADHNCRLVSGGRVLRGQRLRSADEGYANSLGLLNLFGNAEEWVQQGGDFITVGGSALTDMGNCNAAYRNSRTAPADTLRGFRLVRELAP